MVVIDLFNISPQVLPLYQRDVMLCLHGSGCVTVRVRRRTAKPPLTPSQWEQAGAYTITPNVWLLLLLFVYLLFTLVIVYIFFSIFFNFYKFNISSSYSMYLFIVFYLLIKTSLYKKLY